MVVLQEFLSEFSFFFFLPQSRRITLLLVVKDSVSTVLTLFEKKMDVSLKPDVFCFLPGGWEGLVRSTMPLLFFWSDCQLGKKVD